MTSWVVRPIVWFAAASIVTTILHELAHVVTAWLLGVRATLYNYSGNIDLTPAQTEGPLPAIIRIAGPAFCLLFGMLCLAALSRTGGSASGLPLLYLTVYGIATFFGNMMSIAFVGDFSTVAAGLGLPMTARYATALAGALMVAAIHFQAGRRLMRWTPERTDRLTRVAGIVVLPAVLGTVIVMIANWPMPASSVSARLVESSFWLFAAAGGWMTGRGDAVELRTGLGLRWADVAVLVMVVLLVRLMMRGIPFVP